MANLLQILFVNIFATVLFNSEDLCASTKDLYANTENLFDLCDDAENVTNP